MNGARIFQQRKQQWKPASFRKKLRFGVHSRFCQSGKKMSSKHWQFYLFCQLCCSQSERLSDERTDECANGRTDLLTDGATYSILLQLTLPRIIPYSLSLQDLPNNMIHQVPIKSLPQEWLWCETWCDDESLSTAKAIDLVLYSQSFRATFT